MKLHPAILLAAIILPSQAIAQTHELRRDREDIHRAERDLDRAKRYGQPRHVDQARDNLRDARQEYRADWRDYRARDRALYARGDWRAPFRYERFSTGSRLRPAYFDRRYYISDYRRYRLPVPPGDARWVRHYDDVILVSLRSGRVLDVIHGFFW
ncbi:MAG: RcnB family protein [Sphingobium sp.]